MKEFNQNYYKKREFKEFSYLEKLFFKFAISNSLLSNYYFQFLNILENVPKKGKILDLGIANGTFSNFIHRIRPDIEIVGLDLTDVAKLLPKHVRFIKADATNFTLKEKFHLIVTNHLLEHLPIDRVEGVFECAYQHLKKEGFFWVTVPAPSKEFYNDPTHIRPYNKESMKRLLNMYKFENIKVFESNYFRFPLHRFKTKLKIAYGYGKK